MTHLFYLLGLLFAHLSPPQFNGNYLDAMGNNRLGEQLISLVSLDWLVDNCLSCILGYMCSWLFQSWKAANYWALNHFKWESIAQRATFSEIIFFYFSQYLVNCHLSMSPDTLLKALRSSQGISMLWFFFFAYPDSNRLIRQSLCSQILNLALSEIHLNLSLTLIFHNVPCLTYFNF